MEPIISPWIFYLIGKSESFGIMLMMFGLFGSVFSIIGYSFRNDKDFPLKHNNKYLYIPFVIMIFIGSLAPSKNTIIQMLCASQVTPNNVEKIIETGKDFKNVMKSDLIEIIQSVTEDKKE